MRSNPKRKHHERSTNGNHPKCTPCRRCRADDRTSLATGKRRCPGNPRRRLPERTPDGWRQGLLDAFDSVNPLLDHQAQLLPTLLNGAPLVDELVDGNDAGRAWLTPRELEVLAAMADGASNKAIAPAGNLLPHCQVSRRRHSRQAQCGQPDRGCNEGRTQLCPVML